MLEKCPYFPTLGQNTERYSISLGIQSKCRKIQARKTPNTDTFQEVTFFLKKKGRRTIHYNSEKEFSNGTFTELLIDNFSRENLVGNDGKILQRFCEITVRVSNKQTFISREFSEEITKKSRLRDKKELRDHEPKEPWVYQSWIYNRSYW